MGKGCSEGSNWLMRRRFSPDRDRRDRWDNRKRERRRSRSIERKMPTATKLKGDVSSKKVRYPSRSSSHSSYCSTCSYSCSSARSRSRSLISCSTCSGYYSRGSSSSRSPSPKPVKSVRIAGRCMALEEFRKSFGEICEFKLAKGSRPIDPRLGKMFPVPPANLAPVHFQIDKNWTYAKVPNQILLKDFPTSIVSKAQLLGFLETQGIPKNIQDIDLHSGLALIKFHDGLSAYGATDVMTTKGWNWAFDADGHKTQKLIERRQETTAASPLKKPIAETRKSLAEPRQSLSCHPKVPCILVDYEFFPYREASADLAELFGKYRLHSLQRGKESWHIHLFNEDDVEDAYLNRYSFEYNGRRIRPYLSSTISPRKHHEHAPRPSHPKNTSSIDDLRSKILESTLSNATGSAKELKVLEPFAPIDESLLNIPMFNKKYLEKLEAMPEEEDDEEEEEEEEEEESASVSSESQTMASFEEAKESLEVEFATPEPIVQQPEKTPVDDDTDELAGGSARLEGYFKQTHKKVWFEPLQNSASSQTHPKGRAGRATSRRIDGQIAELMGKLSSLQIRQKALILNRSSIHSYGLFAGEDIEPGELVIEYVGEIIRHSLANIREHRYEQALKAAGSDDIASSYFFRLDLTYVVDASNRGNLARFVNHSCDPNCTAKVVQLEGAQHIVFYARRPIAFGEEITYDYKFAIEEDPSKKIRCLCGTASCRKYLN